VTSLKAMHRILEEVETNVMFRFALICYDMRCLYG
jgi:hypothetical protein